MENVLEDKRFAHVAKDPRFRKMPVKERKVKIDKRFKHMFEDKRFKVKYTVDKRGRPVNLTTNENLKKYYELSDEDGSDDDSDESEVDNSKQNENMQQKYVKKNQTSEPEIKGDQRQESNKKMQRAVVNESDESFAEESDGSSEEEGDQSKRDNGVDFARGEGNICSSSSSEDETSEEEDDDAEKSKFDHRWGEVDDTVVEVDESSRRMAVCNMDWDRVKAKDIFVLLNSFKPTSGLIKSVKIYPSEFGKERMEFEEKQGPCELTEVKLDDRDSENDEEDVVDKEGTRYHMEKLREYQLKRLRYFYAVVECDGISTAEAIYKECDSMEYEKSSTKLDLRFIPDDMEFEESEITSSCFEAPPGYKPSFFFNAALSQSKVDLTWDETDRERVQLTAQQFSGKADELQEDDLKAYLASSSDEEGGADYGRALGSDDDDNSDSGGENEDKQIDKYKKLLLDIDTDEKKARKDVQMEITWEPGLKGATENLVKKKKSTKASVWDEYLQKKKEKKKQKIEERKKKKQVQSDEDESGEEEKQQQPKPGTEQQAFSDDDMPDGVDMSDPFFSEEMPSTSKQDKQKKKDKKKKKKNKGKGDNEDTQENAELALLMMDEEEDNRKHFNYNDIVQQDGGKKKKKSKVKHQGQGQIAEEDFQVDVKDNRFTAMYDSHLFNIDPSAPEFKKTKGTEAIITEKLKRSEKKLKKKQNPDHGTKEGGEGGPQAKKVKLDTLNQKPAAEDNLASLVKSVKAKTKHFQSNKVKR